MIHLTLPWPPSVNNYWTPNVVHGRFIGMRLTPRAKVYRSAANCAVIATLGGEPTKIIRQVRVDIEMRAPDKRKRDLDNHLKATLDGLTHAGVWADDSQIDELTVRRGRLISGGQVIVIISELDAELMEWEPEI